MSNRLRAGLLSGSMLLAGYAAPALSLGLQPDSSASLARGVQQLERGIDRIDGRYRADGTAITLGQPAFTAKVAAPEVMAREFLAARASQLGLQSSASAELARTTLREGRSFSVIRFEQRHQGLPIYGSDVAVSVQPNGRVVYVANSAVSHVSDVDVGQGKTSADAIAIAKDYLGVAELRLQQTERMIYAAPDGSHLVWRTLVIAKSGLRGDWELLIDAHTGAVLRAEDTSSYESGTGTIHTPDPLSYERVAYNTTGYVDGNNADTPQLTAALVPVTLDDITLNAGTYTLAGPYAVCEDFDTPHDAGCPSQPTSDFSVTRSAMTYDAVMGYWHISQYLKYVNETLGVPAMPLHHPGGIHYDPHGFDGDDNSQFSSGGENLTFGQGGVDDAQDADVLIHELGHGIHYFVTGGHLSQAEGLSEGVGDYNGAAWSRDFPNQWTPADTAYYWIYSWDGHNPFWAGRVLNYQLNHTYVSIHNQEIHTAGQYWSSCNLLARDILGGVVFDKAYFNGLSMTGASTNQKDAAQAVINAAATLGYSDAQIQVIATAYNGGNTGGNHDCSYNVTVPTTTESPVVSVDTTALTATADAGATASTTLAIGNTGSADLDWNIDTADAATCATPATTPWISFTPASGTVASGAADASVAIALDASTLVPGAYSTNICVHSNDTATPVVAVPITFTVTVPAGDTIFKDGFDAGSAGTCDPVQLFTDPSFEATDAGTGTNPNWTVDDSVSGTPLCDASCDDAATIVAHTGDWFVWFGGYTEPNTGLLSQSVVFPTGQARWLNYWMINQIAGDAAASLKLSIDTTEVSTVPPASDDSSYSAQAIAIPAQYLDGQSHLVQFDWSSPAAAGENASAIIDDVTLDCTAQPTSKPPSPSKAPLLLRKRLH